MSPINFDAATVVGVIVLVLVKTSVLTRYAWPKQDWQKWTVATAAGLAVAVAVRILLR